MVGFKGRDSVSATGSSVSVPSAYPTADKGVIQALKLEFTVGRSDSGELRPEYSTNVALIDFDAIDANSFDAEKIIADCDLLKGIATNYPEELKSIISGLKEGTQEAVDRGLQLANRIGLKEENEISNGGGFLFTVIVIGGGLLLAGCGGANREKVTSPAATTTPKPKPQRDAGTGDGGG